MTGERFTPFLALTDMGRNKPLAAQQPAPAFANDPGGFFGAVLAQNNVSGISSLLPAGTVTQSDVAIKGRLLSSQIGWTPAKASWNGCVLNVSISDAQFLMALEQGGDNQQGRVTVLVEKLKLPGGLDFQSMYGDTFKLQAGGGWHEFVITGMVGQNDDNDPGLTLFLENDQNDIGD